MDETDITNVRDGDAADVTIDAMPGKIFKGHVTQVGDAGDFALFGTGGTTQTTANTQEARDFKVVVTLDNPPDGLRPGLSATREDPDGAQEGCADDSDSGAGGAHARAIWRKRRRRTDGNVTLAASEASWLPEIAQQKTMCRASSWCAGRRRFSCRCRPELPA